MRENNVGACGWVKIAGGHPTLTPQPTHLLVSFLVSAHNTNVLVEIIDPSLSVLIRLCHCHCLSLCHCATTVRPTAGAKPAAGPGDYLVWVATAAAFVEARCRGAAHQNNKGVDTGRWNMMEKTRRLLAIRKRSFATAFTTHTRAHARTHTHTHSRSPEELLGSHHGRVAASAASSACAFAVLSVSASARSTVASSALPSRSALFSFSSKATLAASLSAFSATFAFSEKNMFICRGLQPGWCQHDAGDPTIRPSVVFGMGLLGIGQCWACQAQSRTRRAHSSHHSSHTHTHTHKHTHTHTESGVERACPTSWLFSSCSRATSSRAEPLPSRA